MRQEGGERGGDDSDRTTHKQLEGLSSQDGIYNGIHKDPENLQTGTEPQPMDLAALLRNQSTVGSHPFAAPGDSGARDLCKTSNAPQSRHKRRQDHGYGFLSYLASLDPCSAVFEYIEQLRNGPLDPPVTTDSWRELDLPLIKNNLSLRIDVNYDHDLHFMPISGHRGEEKREEAHKYWQCVVLELRAYQHDALGTCRECHGRKASTLVSFPSRLPRMFRHMKALILLLVPDDDHQRVHDAFDVELLVQEMQNGVLDAGGLALWLKGLLTTHCAPIRDDKAEDMAKVISRAATKGFMQDLVVGLEKLFAFLECMRLDVANHQIRTYRVPLIEDGIAFQIDYFEARIQQRKLSVEGSRQWFLNLRRELRSKASRPLSGRDILACGLIKLCLSDSTQLPITLKHDESRLHAIQQELRDEVHLRVCRKVYNTIITELLRNSPTSTPAHKLRPFIDFHFSTSRIIDLTEHSPQPSSVSSTSSSASSPPLSTATPAPSTWQTHLSSIALDITHQAFRAVDRSSASITADSAALVHRQLQKSFEDEYANQEHTRGLERELAELVLECVDTFDRLGALEIAEGMKAWALGRGGTGTGTGSERGLGGSGAGESGIRTTPDLEDVARRLAHMTVVHWRVWRGLAYLDGNEEDHDQDQDLVGDDEDSILADVGNGLDIGMEEGYDEPVVER